MNYQQVDLDESESFHVSHFAEECQVSIIKPVHDIRTDVKRIIKESSRARLISQIVAAPDDYVAKDFASSFQNATKCTNPPQFLTTHKTRLAPKRNTITACPSLLQSLRWNPFVEMSSTENSLTDIAEESPKHCCRCESCSTRNCPSRVASLGSTKSARFKNNIMTFSDQYTMTPTLSDACCGVCITIPSAPQVSDVCVPPEVPVRSTETVTNLPNMYANQSCNPIPILKRSELSQSAPTYGYCGKATGHVPRGIRQETVKDTDIREDYGEPIKKKSLKKFLKLKKKPVKSRLMLYNEGISDSVTNASPIPEIHVPSPVLLKSKTSSSKSVKSKTKIHFAAENGIPYTHRQSKYHNSCKKPSLRKSSQSSDADEVRRNVPSPPILRKTNVSKPVRPQRISSITLPRKLLISEMDIESYIEKGRPETKAKLSLIGLTPKKTN